MPRILPNHFTDKQLKTLLALSELRGRDRAIFEVLLATGLRASELLALNLEDIDVDRIHVRCGKGGRPRIVPITERAMAALQPVLNLVYTPKCPVFVNVLDGERLSRRGLHRIITSHLKAAGLKGSCHTLRHTAATRWLNKGVTLRSVQALLGHAGIATTAIYLGVAIDGLVAEVRRALAD